MLPQISGEFRLGTDPELRFSPSGVAICKVRAVASKRRNAGTDQAPQWEDAATCWVTLTGFRQMAENMAESLAVRQLVTVTGQLEVEEYEDREGTKRLNVNVLLSSIGPSLSRDAAKVIVREQQGATEQRQGGGGQNDPWAGGAEEPPF